MRLRERCVSCVVATATLAYYSIASVHVPGHVSVVFSPEASRRRSLATPPTPHRNKQPQSRAKTNGVFSLRNNVSSFHSLLFCLVCEIE